MKNLKITPFIVILFFTACSTNQSSSNIDPEETRAVVEHHWEAFIANDLEEVMADYSEESILITPSATYKGLDEIRKNFVNAFETFPTGEASLNLEKTVIEEEVGYILWNASTPSLNLRFGTDTFIVKDGKIVRQTYGGITEGELEG